MEKIFVFIRLTKRNNGKVKVTFHYSDSEKKNFRRISECTPEIQRLALSENLGLSSLQIDFHFETHAVCFDVEKQCGVHVEEIMEHLRNKNLVFDSILTDVDHLDDIQKVIDEMVGWLNAYGSDNPRGKVFVQVGREKKKEAIWDEFSERLILREEDD